MVNPETTARIYMPEGGTPASSVVLVVSASQNTAKRIESYLRNAGHPIRAAWVTDLEELEDVLKRSGPDVLLCEADLASAPDKDVVALCARVAPDVPVILMMDEVAADATAAALATGGRDLVAAESDAQLRHLELVVLRELQAHQHLRELRRARMQLADFESRHKQLLAGTADAVAHVQEGILAHVNPAFADLLGYKSLDDLQGNPFMDLVGPDHQAKVKEHFKQLIKKKIGDGPLEFVLVGEGGKLAQVKAQLTRSEAEGGTLIEMLIRQEAPAATSSPAPVPQPDEAGSGRSAFFEMLVGPQPPAAVRRGILMLHVDDFATLEERLGFRDAEQIIRTLLQLVNARLAPTDLKYRFSTGELAVLVVRPAAVDFEQLCDLLRKDITTQLFKTSGFEAHITATLIAYPLSGKEVETKYVEIVNEMGVQLRRLANQGGNRFSILGPAGADAKEEAQEQRTAEWVRKALETNQLKLAYQSIASLEGDPRQHFDVYVRLLDEAGREMMAREFMPAAEKHGLVSGIDRWVVQRVLKIIAKRAAANEVSSLFVRLSEETLRDAEQFVVWLHDQLKTRPLQKDELIFQLQEPSLQTHIRKARGLSKALRELNADMAVDYFGVSPHSAQILEHVPASFVKFHSSYTTNFNEKDKQKRLGELLEIAKQRKIKTIVSHVEDANVMARLWQMGVNYIQGHSVQEPEVVLLAAEVPGGAR